MQGGRLEGYQLAATSSGITAELARELTLWGPAHDSLWDTRKGARSVNFHPLASGDLCLSCTTLAGQEYSARGGGRVYTQMFLLSGELLARFANDPFLVLRTIEAGGRLIVHDEVPVALSSIHVVGRCTQPDSTWIAPVAEEIALKAFEEIVEAVTSSTSVAVVANGRTEQLFQAILHSLSQEQRLSVSFTTGLKHSPRRPFKLFAVPNDSATIRHSQRLNGARVIELAAA